MSGLIPYSKRNNELSGRDGFFNLRSIFDDFFSDSIFPAFMRGEYPINADIRESEKEYVIEAEIPGVKKEDIKLDLRDSTLSISVEHNEETKEERGNYIRRERKSGSFCRSFYVENVSQDGVSAKYVDGILKIVLPKQEPGKMSRRNIEIQ
jgi:HSP20 family protein